MPSHPPGSDLLWRFTTTASSACGSTHWPALPFSFPCFRSGFCPSIHTGWLCLRTHLVPLQPTHQPALPFSLPDSSSGRCPSVMPNYSLFYSWTYTLASFAFLYLAPLLGSTLLYMLASFAFIPTWFLFWALPFCDAWLLFCSSTFTPASWPFFLPGSSSGLCPPETPDHSL